MSPAPKMPGSTINPDDTIDALWTRYDEIVRQDQEKTLLIEEVLTRYQTLNEQFTKKCQDHERETDYARAVQVEKKNLDNQLRQYVNFLERDPFVVVLIDADGMIFQDALLNAGDAGGKQAADGLFIHMTQHIDMYAETIPRNAKIVTRVYANVKGLADICLKTGIIDEFTKIEDFAHGFTRGRVLFDFVDVGPGKDRADEKIIETFKLYIHNIHCRQVFFGCSHDNGYARVLEENANDPYYNSRITLLEGVPFEKELKALPYKTQKFKGLFRDTKIVDTRYGATTGYPSAFPPPFRRPGLGNAKRCSDATPGSSPYELSRNPSISTIGSNVDPFSSPAPAAASWATLAAAPPPMTVTPPPSKVARDTTPTTIPRNRAGQRVDPQTRNYEKDEVNRVKNLKMCNIHFLRNECPYGSSCTHVHSYKPSNAELATLRLVARMAPCVNGSNCDDLKCIYGHRCPAPDAKARGKGGSLCIFGDKCKFPAELHQIDTNVVRTLVIR